MADHEIRISTRIDTSQMQRLQLQIDKATDKVENLRTENPIRRVSKTGSGIKDSTRSTGKACS